MSDPDIRLDEKTPSSSTLCSPSSPSTFDLESGQDVRRPTWKNSFLGICQQSNVTRQQFSQKKKEMQEDIKSTVTRTLESCPDGYPRLAGFLSSESNFSLYRGFSYLHSRVLLQLQDDIAVLEQELDFLDAADRDDSRTKNLKRGRYDKKHPRPEEDGFRSRKEILANIHSKLLEYDEMLIKAREMQAIPKPSERDYRSVRSWFWNETPLSNDAEACFIRKKEDIISLRSGREWSGFDGFIENTLRRFDCKLIRVSVRSIGINPTLTVNRAYSAPANSKKKLLAARSFTTAPRAWKHLLA